MSLFFITGNQGKFTEVKALMPQVEQLDLDLPEIQSLDPHEIIGYKLKAAQAIKPDTSLMVEDTGLYMDCLNGMPGPLIKWFLKSINIEGLSELAKVLGNAKAQAKTVVGYIDAQGREVYAEGVVNGTIVPPRGENGFGWDPIFQPEGLEKTFAELTREEKNLVSMRQMAVKELIKQL